MDKETKKVLYTSEWMYPLVEKFLSMNTTQKSFSEQEGLSQHVFGYWVRKYKTEQVDKAQDKESKFVNLQVKSEKVKMCGLEISYANGTVLRLGDEIGWPLLDKLLTKLSDVSLD